MIETEQLDAEFGRALLRLPVIAGANKEAAPWTFFGRIRQRHEIGDRAVASEQRAAAFVRIGLLAVCANRLVDGRCDRQGAGDARLKGSRSFGLRSFGLRSFGSRFF